MYITHEKNPCLEIDISATTTIPFHLTATTEMLNLQNSINVSDVNTTETIYLGTPLQDNRF